MNQQELRSTVPTSDAIADLQYTGLACRRMVLDMLTAAGSSHLGCSYSIIDILVTLYHAVMDVQKIKEKAVDRDLFILSKGHGVSALYAVLASAGFFDPACFALYHKQGTPLTGHPMRNSLPGIEASTGSLGHGLSLAVGYALARKHDGITAQVYVVMGDGECQEGSVWEALNMASRFALNNLTIIIDYNNLQGLDRSDDINGGASLGDKCTAFGARVHHVDGHDYAALCALFDSYRTALWQGPDVVIAHTTKARGIPWMADRLEWHYKSCSPSQYQDACQELDACAKHLLKR